MAILSDLQKKKKIIILTVFEHKIWVRIIKRIKYVLGTLLKYYNSVKEYS